MASKNAPTITCVADRLGRLTVPLVPRARPPVQRRDLVGLLCQQMRAENVGKEVVVAIPEAPVVQRDDEEVAALQGLQPRRASLLVGDGVAQWAVQPVQDGGPEQEAADRLGLTPQDLLDQVVHDVPVVSGEGPDESGNILVALQGQRGQLQAGDPAFGAVVQRGDVLR